MLKRMIARWREERIMLAAAEALPKGVESAVWIDGRWVPLNAPSGWADRYVV